MTDETVHIDPICAIHGKRWSQHDGGRCLYCCICFVSLDNPDECWRDADGQLWDMCISCGNAERQAAIADV